MFSIGDQLMGRDEALLQPATDAAGMLRRKELSSRELTAMLLARIDDLNPTLNAVVELRREPALREAAAADEAIARGDDLGPLHGVPKTIKDGFDVAGLHTTWGNPAFKEFVAGSDATVVRRLRQAGAILVGKTNLAFMLGDFGQSANVLYGVTNNPWDTARMPGGSSGGAAAALAAGMTFLEYGSDLVGSIRIPASFCGVYGLKPSVQVVPSTCSSARRTSPRPFRTTPGRSASAPSPPPKAGGPMPTRPSGSPTRRCPGCQPWRRPSGARRAGSPWARRSWARCTRTTPRSPSPSCSATSSVATSPRRCSGSACAHISVPAVSITGRTSIAACRALGHRWAIWVARSMVSHSTIR